MSNRVFENILIVTLIGIIFCLLFPIVQRIIYKSEIEGVKASVYGSIESVKLLYLNESNADEIGLPFTVVYNENGYKTYIGKNEYRAFYKMDIHGRKPIGGTINITPAGLVTVTKLKFKNYMCSMPPGGDLTCKRNS